MCSVLCMVARQGCSPVRTRIHMGHYRTPTKSQDRGSGRIWVKIELRLRARPSIEEEDDDDNDETEGKD